MRHLHFIVTLHEDVIFSERSASIGGHATLDHLPGAAFLGYCAGKLYTTLGADAYTVFHSGKVRFNNAYPLTERDAPTLPVPLCWHLEKGKSIDTHGDELVNLIHTPDENFKKWEEKGIQQKQVRSGFFDQTGCYLTPDRRFRLKTAIDRSKLGRAADSQLFGYECLVAGSRWSFSIDLDATLGSNLDDQLRNVLTDKTFRIGQSRTAEYGLVEVTEDKKVNGTFKERATDGVLLLIYALSDLALHDPQTGAPTLVPPPKCFSLPDDVIFAPDKSYLRTRCYAPFNGHRSTFDLERQVIAKGSVLTFRRKEGTFAADELTACRAAVAGGVGSYRYDGLGQVLVQPKFLDKTYPIALTRMAIKEMVATTVTPDPVISLKGWLSAKTAQRAAEQQTIATVAEWVGKLVYKDSLDRLPRNSQWGQLRNIAMNATDRNNLVTVLFAEGSGFCTHGVAKKQWDKEESRGVTYAQFLKDTVIGTETDFTKVRSRLYLLSNRLPRRVNQLIRKEGK